MLELHFLCLYNKNITGCKILRSALPSVHHRHEKTTTSEIYCYYFNGQKLKRLHIMIIMLRVMEVTEKTISYFIIYINYHMAANTFIGRDRSSLSCPPAKLGNSMWLHSSAL